MMTIREVIELLMKIFPFLVEMFGKYFGSTEEDAEVEA